MFTFMVSKINELNLAIALSFFWRVVTYFRFVFTEVCVLASQDLATLPGGHNCKYSRAPGLKLRLSNGEETRSEDLIVLLDLVNSQ